MDQTNKISYIEFQASDLEGSKAFCEKVFGWVFTDYGPDYTSFEDGRISGGFARATAAAQAGGGPLVVLYHPELEKALQKVVAHGGVVTREIFSFPGGRRFHFTEPSGNELSIWSDR